MGLSQVTGFLVAAITPFTVDGKINGDAMLQLMRRNIQEGAAGFLIGGSSGECPLLSASERIESLEIAAEFAKETTLIASCSAIGTAEAKTYAQKAEKLGYSAVISTVPHYYRFTMPAIASYFKAVKAATSLPLMLYNFPGNTGVELDLNVPDIATILADGTIAGVKQTSLNLYQMERMKTLNPNLSLFGGYDEVYLAARMMGAQGAIGSTFNFTLPLFVQMEEAFVSLDLPRAQVLQSKANNIMHACVREGLFPSIKHIINKTGIDAGKCREPFVSLTTEQKQRIENVVRENMPNQWCNVYNI